MAQLLNQWIINAKRSFVLMSERSALSAHCELLLPAAKARFEPKTTDAAAGANVCFKLLFG